MHYQRWRKSPEGRAFREDNATPEQRFWAKVDKSGDCWLWTGFTSDTGYGYAQNGLAHHFLVGKPTLGFEWDHLCYTRNCVRPDHLEMVPRAVNIARQRHHGPPSKDVCINGHPYDTDNTRILPTGKRACRMCTHEAVRRWRSRQRTTLPAQ